MKSFYSSSKSDEGVSFPSKVLWAASWAALKVGGFFFLFKRRG